MREPPTNICPLLAIAGMGGINSPASCIKDCCAWAYEGRCAITTIARRLDGLNESGIIVWPEEGTP